MSANGGTLDQQTQNALMGNYGGAAQQQTAAPMVPQSQQQWPPPMPQGGPQQSPPLQWGQGPQGSQPNYMSLMRSLMMNPGAFTGGAQGASPFAQALAANPQAASLASWQPAAPVQQQVADPVAAFLAQQQAAQAAAAQQAAQQAAAQPPPQPYDSNPGGSGAE